MPNTELDTIFIGVEAVTVGFQNVLNKVSKLGKDIDTLNSSRVKGDKKVISSLGKQESAIKKSIQTALDLRQALVKAGAPPKALLETTNTLRKLTTALSSGEVSTLKFTRAQDAASASVRKQKRQLKDLVQANKDANRSRKQFISSFSKASSASKSFGSTSLKSANRTKNLQEAIRDLQSASVLAVGPLSGIGSRIGALGAISARSSLKVVAFFTAFTASVVGLTALFKGAINAEIALQKVNRVMLAATGSSEAAAEQFAFVTETADRLGLDLLSTANSFANFTAATKGTNLEGEKTKVIFTELLAVASALNFDAPDTTSLFRAFKQIVSKGKVATEEISGQLGEKLPGAFALFAKSQKLTPKELTKALQLGAISPDSLLEFAKTISKAFGVDSTKTVDTFAASLARLNTAQLLFSDAFNQNTDAANIFKAAIDSFAGVIKFATRNMNALVSGVSFLATGFAFSFVKTALATQAIASWSVAMRVATVQTSLFSQSVAFATVVSKKLVRVLKLFKNPFTFLLGVAAAVAVKLLFFRDSQDKTSESSREMIDRLTEARKSMEELSKAAANVELSKIGQKLLKERLSIVQFESEIRRLIALQKVASTQGPISRAIASVTADKVIKKLKDKISTAKQTVEDLKKLIPEVRDEAFKPVKSPPVELDIKITDAQKKAQQAIQQIKDNIAAQNKGPVEFEAFKILTKKNKDIEDFKKSLQIQGKDIFSKEETGNIIATFSALIDKQVDSNKKFEETKQKLQQLGKIGEDALSTIEDGIFSVIDGTNTMGQVFANVIDDMLRQLAKFFLEAAIGGKKNLSDNLVGLLGSALGFFGGGGGSKDQGTPTTFSPGGIPIPGRPPKRAKGGAVQRNKTFLVGEKGPELFKPSSNGAIIPNNAMVGGGANVTVTVINNASGAKATTRETGEGSNRSIEVLIDDMVASKLSNPTSRTTKALRGSLSQGIIRR